MIGGQGPAMVKPILLLISTAVMTLVMASQASHSATANISQSEELAAWKRMELTSVWSRVIQMDRNVDRVKHMQVHVQQDAQYPVYHVVSDRGREGFSSREIDHLGLTLGDVQSKRRADQRVRDLVAMGYKAESRPEVFADVRLYVQTESGLLQAIDGESGRSLWSITVGTRSGLVFPVAIRDKRIAVVSGTRVVVIDSTTGSELWSADVRGIPIAGPALTDRLVIVPLLNGFVDGFPIPLEADKKANTAPVTKSGKKSEEIVSTRVRFVASGQVSASPAVAGNIVAWGSDQGIVNVATLQPSRLKFRMHTAPIATELVFRSGEELLVADRHGYVQSFDITRGTTRWQTSTGQQIRRSPVCINDNVFVATQRGGLLCLDAGTGIEKWQSPSITAISAVSGEYIYAQDHFGAIRKLRTDNGKAVVVGTRHDGNVVVTNSMTDRIYLADAAGRVVCLREANQAWPRFHSPPAKLPEVSSGGDVAGKNSVAPPVSTPAKPNPEVATSDSQDTKADTTIDAALPSSDEGDPFNQESVDDPFATP